MANYKTSLYTLVSNTMTMGQFNSKNRDEYGNPLDMCNRIMFGMICNASSVYRDEIFYQPYLVFNNNPQGWSAGENDKEANLVIKMGHYEYRGNEIEYVPQPGVCVNKIKLEIDNSNKNVDRIVIQGCNTDGEKILFDSVLYEKGIKRYVDEYITANNPGVYDEFKITVYNHGRFFLKGLDLLREISSCEGDIKPPCIIPPHKHKWEDIVNPPEIPECPPSQGGDGLLLKPVNTKFDLPNENVTFGSMCFVVAERTLYIYLGTEWLSLNEGAVKREPVLLRKIVIDREHLVHDLGVNLTDLELEVIDEDNIKWNFGDNEDYIVNGNEIKFNFALPYPLNIYVYRKSNRTDDIYLYLVSPSEHVFSFGVDEEGDFTSVYYGELSDMAGIQGIYDYLYIRSNNDLVYVYDIDDDGYLLTSEYNEDEFYRCMKTGEFRNSNIINILDNIKVVGSDGNIYYLDVDEDGNLFIVLKLGRAKETSKEPKTEEILKDYFNFKK